MVLQFSYQNHVPAGKGKANPDRGKEYDTLAIDCIGGIVLSVYGFINIVIIIIIIIENHRRQGDWNVIPQTDRKCLRIDIWYSNT